MKRSKTVSLVLMSSIPLMLAACTQVSEPSSSSLPVVYDTVDSCVKDGKNDVECKKALDQATAHAASEAPRFTTIEDCEMTFEQCGKAPEVAQAGQADAQPAGAVTQHSGGGSFMPMMAGFMMGQMMGNSSNAGMASSFNQGSPAVYRSKNGQLMHSNRLADGKVAVSPASNVRSVNKASLAARATTSSRGGFGGRAGSMGG